MMLQEPLMLVFGFLAFFIAAMGAFRLDLKLSPKDSGFTSLRSRKAGKPFIVLMLDCMHRFIHSLFCQVLLVN